MVLVGLMMRGALLMGVVGATDPCGMDDIHFTSVVHNNLGGKGPSLSDPEELRFGKALVKNGATLDLVITAVSSYVANTDNNGLWPKSTMGTVNVMQDSHVDLKFTFVKAGTSEIVEVDKFLFSVFDIDEGKKHHARESVILSGFSEVDLANDTEISVTIVGNKTMYQSTVHGVGGDNPTDIRNLTPEQKRRAVGFHFSNVPEIDATFSVTKGNGGRNFLFAGASSMSCKPVPPPTPLPPHPTPVPTPKPPPTPAPAFFSCDECISRGYKDDTCGCGVCGSYGGCSFSCKPDGVTLIACNKSSPVPLPAPTPVPAPVPAPTPVPSPKPPTPTPAPPVIFPCDECSARGYKDDICDCGVCGSFGGCSFSCKPDGVALIACNKSSPVPTPVPVPTPSPVKGQCCWCSDHCGDTTCTCAQDTFCSRKENCDGCAGKWCPLVHGPTLDDLCDESKANYDLKLSNLTNNNLDGKGPWTNTTEKTIRYSQAIVKDGEVLDLVVTAETPYAGRSRNGVWKGRPMGVINLAANYSMDLKLTFVKPGTFTPVVVDGFLFTITDLDTSTSRSAIESVTLGGFLNATTLGNSTLTVVNHDGVTTFGGSIDGSASDNPTDMMHLTPEQQAKTVSLQYNRVSEIKMTLSVQGGKNPRNFYFAGKSSPPCTSPKSFVVV